MKSKKKYKVEDTRMRSLAKSVTARILEIIVDTLLIGTILTWLGIPHGYEIGGVFAITTEFLCFLVSYFVDRLWNRIQWGRKVMEIESRRKQKT